MTPGRPAAAETLKKELRFGQEIVSRQGRGPRGVRGPRLTQMTYEALPETIVGVPSAPLSEPV